MKNLYSLGLAFLLAFTVTGCQLYFGEEGGSNNAECRADGYYVDDEWVSAQCPGGGNECENHLQCAAGCFCASDSQTCEEGGFCATAEDCAPGFKCDVERSSCIPREGSCAGAIAPTCNIVAPKCAQGSVPLIEDGCYFDENGDGTFDCSAIGECLAPPACTAYQHEGDCAAAGCTSIQRGFNCHMPNSTTPCTGGQAGCICDIYQFERCEAAPGM